jgi:hypothetical protein
VGPWPHLPAWARPRRVDLMYTRRWHFARECLFAAASSTVSSPPVPTPRGIRSWACAPGRSARREGGARWPRASSVRSGKPIGLRIGAAPPRSTAARSGRPLPNSARSRSNWQSNPLPPRREWPWPRSSCATPTHLSMRLEQGRRCASAPWSLAGLSARPSRRALGQSSEQRVRALKLVAPRPGRGAQSGRAGG